MLNELINASDWTAEQWLAAIILVFIVIAVLVLMYRMFTLFRMARKRPYKPNLRPLRRRRVYHNQDQNESQDDD